MALPMCVRQVASDFRLYDAGVYDSKVCKNGPEDVNHAVGEAAGPMASCARRGCMGGGKRMA